MLLKSCRCPRTATDGMRASNDLPGVEPLAGGRSRRATRHSCAVVDDAGLVNKRAPSAGETTSYLILLHPTLRTARR